MGATLPKNLKLAREFNRPHRRDVFHQRTSVRHVRWHATGKNERKAQQTIRTLANKSAS